MLLRFLLQEISQRNKGSWDTWIQLYLQYSARILLQLWIGVLLHSVLLISFSLCCSAHMDDSTVKHLTVSLQLLCDSQVRENTGKQHTEHIPRQLRSSFKLGGWSNHGMTHSVRKERILANRNFKTYKKNTDVKGDVLCHQHQILFVWIIWSRIMQPGVLPCIVIMTQKHTSRGFQDYMCVLKEIENYRADISMNSK